MASPAAPFPPSLPVPKGISQLEDVIAHPGSHKEPRGKAPCGWRDTRSGLGCCQSARPRAQPPRGRVPRRRDPHGGPSARRCSGGWGAHWRYSWAAWRHRPPTAARGPGSWDSASGARLCRSHRACDRVEAATVPRRLWLAKARRNTAFIHGAHTAPPAAMANGQSRGGWAKPTCHGSAGRFVCAR
jgi:hypothetical protein